MQPTLISYTLMNSPLGDILLTASDAGIHHILFTDMREAERLLSGNWNPVAHPFLSQAQGQLEQYFAGQRQSFDLPLAAQGTNFQRKVWEQLNTIPYAITWDYGQLALAIQQPTAARAVGMANGKNPLSIVVPCHRVIGKNRQLTGYAGGLQRKAWLLDHEARYR
jgi:methylated-DNA-[protein]-cysteine S-methyltransferase